MDPAQSRRTLNFMDPNLQNDWVRNVFKLLSAGRIQIEVPASGNLCRLIVDTFQR